MTVTSFLNEGMKRGQFSMAMVMVIVCLLGGRGLCETVNANANARQSMSVSLQLPFRALANFSLAHPSFPAILPLTNSSLYPDLVITSFAALGSGSISIVKNIGKSLQTGTPIKPVVAAGSLNWPNGIVLAPSGIFPSPTLIWADGFLVPLKNNGYIYGMQYDVSSGAFSSPFPLTEKKNGYFYHKVVFFDLNGDGLLDIVTARVNKPVIGSSVGELLWLQQPSEVSARVKPWPEYVIANGPDVDFYLGELDHDSSTIEVLAAQFFSEKLAGYVIDLSTQKLKSSVVIDSSIGAAYSVSTGVFNGDGQRQALVTNHAPSADTSGMWLYEIPNDFLKGNWTAGKHLIAKGFPVDEGGLNQAAPGYAYGVFPKAKPSASDVPVILVAGDGAQRAYYFQRVGSYKYEQTEIVDVKGVVGALAIGDVDNDGWNEIFVPDYDHGAIYVYTFAP